jgi:hypothetical protein
MIIIPAELTDEIGKYLKFLVFLEYILIRPKNTIFQCREEDWPSGDA